MKCILYTSFILCTTITSVLTQARRVVIELDHAHYSENLSSREIDIIGSDLTLLLRQYIELSGFQDESGIYSSAQNKTFVKLFLEDAELYSDLHVEYTTLSPLEYVSTVSNYFGDYGVDANLEYAGLIAIEETDKKNIFKAHLSIQKVNYSRISPTNERQFFKHGQVAYFDLFVSVDLKNNDYLISRISNDQLKDRTSLLVSNVIDIPKLNTRKVANLVNQNALMPLESERLNDNKSVENVDQFNNQFEETKPTNAVSTAEAIHLSYHPNLAIWDLQPTMSISPEKVISIRDFLRLAMETTSTKKIETENKETGADISLSIKTSALEILRNNNCPPKERRLTTNDIEINQSKICTNCNQNTTNKK